MAITVTSDLNGLLPIIYKEARMTAIETPIMRNLVTKYDIKNKPGQRVDIPKWGTVTAEALTQGVDMTNMQTLGTSSLPFTVGEAGAQTGVTDDDIEDANDDVIKKHGRILGEAIATKDDVDALTLFSSLSGGLGAAGATITLGYFTATLTQLRAAYAKGEYYCVLHPYVYHDLAESIILNSSYGQLLEAGSDIAKKFRAKEFMGVGIYEDANITVDASDDSYGAMFTKECFCRVDKRPLRIEKERDASLRGWELNATTRYIYGEVEDTFGKYLLFDTQAPTS